MHQPRYPTGSRWRSVALLTTLTGLALGHTTTIQAASDAFDYSESSLYGQSGGSSSGGIGWTSSWYDGGAATSATVIDAALESFGSDGSDPYQSTSRIVEYTLDDVAASLESIREIGHQSGKVVWVYGMVAVGNAFVPDVNMRDSFGGFGLFEGGNEKLLIGQPYEAGVWGVASAMSGGDTHLSLRSIGSNEGVLLVAKIDQTANLIQVWVDPPLSSASEYDGAHDIEFSYGSGVDDDFDRIRIRGGNYNTGNVWQFDNLQVTGDSPFCADDDQDGICNDVDGCTVDVDGDGYISLADCPDVGDDCDDDDASAYPGNLESCDGVDNDCDADIDEDFDQDGDGYFDAFSCGGNYDVEDCDDLNDFVYPGAEELCNSTDDDCDGDYDEGFDEDGDGYLNQELCIGYEGILDCDDYYTFINPGETETCDTYDNDCDGDIDEDFDNDFDGYFDATYCPGEIISQLDCDDNDFSVNPEQPEFCDGIDNNCDFQTDEGYDNDVDGYYDSASCGDVNGPGDCDDVNGSIYPDATESCDGLDNNCDGDVDEDFDADGDGYLTASSCGELGSDCDDDNGSIYPGSFEVCDGIDNNCDGQIDEGYDVDGDGSLDASSCGELGTDCNDGDGAIYPGAAELCDGIDNNCDGAIDEGFDADNDTYLDASSCSALGGELDCNDGDGGVNPGVTEQCDEVDNDCDGSIDEQESECGCGDGDEDGDGACDLEDTCLEIYNPDQVDQDRDGLGDPCDAAPADPTVGADDADSATVIDPDDNESEEDGYGTPGDGFASLATDDGVAFGDIPIDEVDPYATFSIVDLGLEDLETDLGDIRVQGLPDPESLEPTVLLNYEYQIGPDDLSLIHI